MKVVKRWKAMHSIAMHISRARGDLIKHTREMLKIEFSANEILIKQIQ